MAGLMLLGGCGAPKYAVEVSLDDGWRAAGFVPTMQVDLVGANAQQAKFLRDMSMTEYFDAGNAYRADLDKHTMLFSDADAEPKMLTKDDPVWAAWNADMATELFVLVNLPGVSDDLPGDMDQRRLILPLAPEAWGGSDIMVSVGRSGPEVVTPPAPVTP
jgi:hypothetical protein